MPTWSETIQDYNGETSVTGINVGAVTAVSLPGLLSDIADYRAGIDGLILGTVKSDQLVAYKTPGTNALPADQNAQVERKWLVTYDDITQYFDAPINSIPNAGFGKIFNVEIATADATLLDDNQEFLPISSGPGLAFASAFNTLAKSPYGGTARVLTIELVGRTR
jgi:hypothetical protein